MTRHDPGLWAYASRELELGERRYVESHLEDCPECVEQLAAVQVAREALELAREASPRVKWEAVDERVGAMVERRLAAKARGPWLTRLGLGAFACAAAAAALAFVLTRPAEDVVPREDPGEVELAPLMPRASWARVDKAEGLTRLGASGGEVRDGAELRAGDVLRTSLAGRAFVHLPDASHVRLGGGSQVAITRTEADDVALTLERGRVAVAASHEPRRGFVIHSGGVTVHVVGTVFGVSREAEVVEVAVSQGKVRVELPNGDSTFVSPGERLRFDARSEKARRLKLTTSLTRELTEVADLADTTASVEQRAVVPAAGGATSRPPMVTAQGTPRTLPRLSAEEARARQGTLPAPLDPATLPPVVAPTPVEAKPAQPTIVLQAPEDVWPSLAGGEVVRGVPPKREPPPASRPDEWAALPAPAADEWAPLPQAAPKVEAPPVKAAPRPAAGDLEAQFLARAEAAVGQGACEKFLPGLEDIALDAQRGPRSEQARILRARCLEAELRPRQAMSEYRKYVEEYSAGQHVAEARRALGE